MKYTFWILALCSLFVLSSCWKKDEVSIADINWNASVENNIETEIINQAIPEPIGEEEIVAQYISEVSSNNGWNTDEKILFFYSESSEKSKEFDAILKSDERPEIYSDILRINFDEESAAKEDYGVVEANTFVLVDESWTLVKKIENIWNIENILTLYE